MQRRHSRRLARGQAVMELALGLTVFVTILIFAIHFAEVGYLSVKVTEAAHSALFDATAHQLHQWPADTSPASNAVSRAANDAQSRYADFDSRTRRARTSGTGVFTRIRGMRVECSLGEGPDYTRDFATMRAYGDNGGINCQSNATVNAVNIASSFLEGSGGLFAARHHVPTTIRVCGIGRSNGGDCGARLVMQLDDWGLSGADESKECRLNVDSPLGSCDNDPFFKMARSTYLVTMAYGGHNGAASRFAWQIVGAAPILPMGESAFFMSALGEESKFTQSLTTEGHRTYPTTPAAVGRSGVPAHKYDEAYGKRSACWLGLKCPPRG